MRYRFVDEIVSLTLDGAPRIEVAKRFDAGEDVFSGPEGPEHVPESMLLELMAMTGGHLIFRHLGERRLPLLLKVPDCRFEGTAAAGERLLAVAALGGVAAVAGGTGVAGTEARGDRQQEQIARAGVMVVGVGGPGV